MNMHTSWLSEGGAVAYPVPPLLLFSNPTGSTCRQWKAELDRVCILGVCTLAFCRESIAYMCCVIQLLAKHCMPKCFGVSLCSFT